jgi:hypothetical protein
MKPAKPYMLGFWVMFVIVVFRLILVIGTYLLLRRYDGRAPESFNWFMFLTAMIMIIETMVYWYRRYHIPNKLWVHIHTWTTFTAMVVIPGVMILVTPILMRAYYQQVPPETEYFNSQGENIFDKITRIRFYVFWGLTIIGHIFFIATIVKSLQIKESEPDESAGLLDEFVDQR